MRNKNTQTRLKRLSPEQFMAAYGYDNIVARQWLHDFVRANNGWLWYGDKSTYTNGVLDLIGGEHTQPTILDPGCDDYTKWTAVNTATLSNPSTGIMRVAYGGNANPGARQATILADCWYTGSVQCRPDGTRFGRMTWGGASPIDSTTTASWQNLSSAGTASSTSVYLYNIGSAGYAEFDNFSMQNRSIIYQPPKVGTGVLTQSTATAMPYGGDSGTAASPGRRIITFDGTADYISCSNLSSFATGNASYTILYGGKHKATDSIRNVTRLTSVGGAYSAAGVSAGKWRITRNDNASTNYIVNSVVAADTNAHIFEETYSSTIHNLLVDGTSVATKNPVTTSTITLDDFAICGPTATANLDLYSFVILPGVISATNRSTIRRILGAMNSITVTP